MNARPLPYQGSALPLSYKSLRSRFGGELRRYKQLRVQQHTRRLMLQLQKNAPCISRAKSTPNYVWRFSTPLRQKLGAGERDRTVVCSLEGCRSTIELLPHNLKFTRKYSWWRELDSNQRTRKRADLQSAAINHSAISPKEPAIIQGFRSIVNGIRRINTQLAIYLHFYCADNPVFCARKISASCGFN